MTALNRIVSAITFAVLWTGFMLWWSYPDQGIAHTAILVAMGGLCGIGWYWLFPRFQRSGR